MNKRKTNLPPRPQPIKKQNSSKLPPKNTRLKRTAQTPKKSSSETAVTNDLGSIELPVNIESINNLIKSNSIELPAEATPPPLVNPSISTTEESIPLSNSPNNETPVSHKGYMGHIKEMYGEENEAIKKRQKQKEYMKQLEDQIKEKDKLKKEGRVSFKTTRIDPSWLSDFRKQEEQVKDIPKQEKVCKNNDTSPSITGSRRGYVPNRLDVLNSITDSYL